jgi:hypothetical protein
MGIVCMEIVEHNSFERREERSESRRGEGGEQTLRL